MKKLTPFVLLLMVSVFLPGNGNAQHEDSLYLPDSLPEIDFETHVCGTAILLGIPDLVEEAAGTNPITGEPEPSTVASYEVGDTREFKVFNFEESSNVIQNYDDILFELRKVGDFAEIWVEKEELGEGRITQEVVDAVMKALEDETPVNSFDPNRGIIDISQELFGDPPDVDDSGKVKVLLVDIRDGWDPEEGGGFIAGFFNPGDQQNPLLNSNSNHADIIYIDTYPGIYRDGHPADPSRPLNVVAHEYQHLIHHEYGNLITFQNEAQSEVAEILTGFQARDMRFLDDKNELSGDVSSSNGSGLYRWRRSDINSVLYDYQRAGLFHGYLNERVGPQLTGSITRSDDFGKFAYEEALAEHGIEWEEFLSEFYVASLLNDLQIADGRFGYSRPQFSGISASGIGVTYSGSGETLEQKEVTLHYGGAKYTQWQNPTDLQLNVSDEGGLRYYAASRSSSSGSFRVDKLDTGSTTFSGSYDSIILIAVNVSERNNDELNPGTRSYTYSTGEPTDIDPKEIVSEYRLLGNFPNPFNPATSIRYQLPKSGHVRIDIYDATGRKISTLVDGTRNEGTHNEVFRADGLSSGLYIYRLTAGDFARTGKMMLVK